MDLTTNDETGNAWDLSDPAQRLKAKQLLDQQAPTLLVCSPMCTPFSRIQSLNRELAKRGRCNLDKLNESRARAMVHLEFVCELYLQQVSKGFFFLHEQPEHADSWQEQCLREVLCKKGVLRVGYDQCMYGQQTIEGQPNKKPTGFTGNCPALMKLLQQ